MGSSIVGKKGLSPEEKISLKQKNDLQGGLSEPIKISSNAKKKKKKEKNGEEVLW